MKISEDGCRIDETDIEITSVTGLCPNCNQRVTLGIGNSVICPNCHAVVSTTMSPLLKLIAKPIE